MRVHSAALVTVLIAGCSAVRVADPGLQRCIWVTRWDWRTPADIQQIMQNCAAAGFRTVLFQVRGNGTVLYRSQLEVWSEHFEYRDPGFDPLQVAIDSARRHGLQLHAWCNVTPGWRGDRPPADPRQLARAHPEWFLADERGEPQPRARSGYQSLNVCLPEVREYLTSVVRELATAYALDGIHLDYIRFPSKDGEEDGAKYGRDRRTFEIFRRAKGRDPRLDALAFERFKSECVTELVRSIRAAVLNTPRAPQLSAAVWATPALAREKVNQDWEQWTKAGLVDAVFPMNYQSDDTVFALQVREAVARSHGVPVVVGIGAHKHTSATQTIRQMDVAMREGSAGVSLFGYESLHARAGVPPERKQTQLRDAVSRWKGVAVSR